MVPGCPMQWNPHLLDAQGIHFRRSSKERDSQAICICRWHPRHFRCASAHNKTLKTAYWSLVSVSAFVCTSYAAYVVQSCKHVCMYVEHKHVAWVWKKHVCMYVEHKHVCINVEHNHPPCSPTEGSFFPLTSFQPNHCCSTFGLTALHQLARIADYVLAVQERAERSIQAVHKSLETFNACVVDDWDEVQVTRCKIRTFPCPEHYIQPQPSTPALFQRPVADHLQIPLCTNISCCSLQLVNQLVALLQ